MIHSLQRVKLPNCSQRQCFTWLASLVVERCGSCCSVNVCSLQSIFNAITKHPPQAVGQETKHLPSKCRLRKEQLGDRKRVMTLSLKLYRYRYAPHCAFVSWLGEIFAHLAYRWESSVSGRGLKLALQPSLTDPQDLPPGHAHSSPGHTPVSLSHASQWLPPRVLLHI